MIRAADDSSRPTQSTSHRRNFYRYAPNAGWIDPWGLAIVDATFEMGGHKSEKCRASGYKAVIHPVVSQNSQNLTQTEGVHIKTWE
jgi:hypothetical protein